MEAVNIDELVKIVGNLKESSYFDESELDIAVQSAKLDLNKEYEKPICFVEIVEENDVRKEVLTSGNISTVIGGAKSKKTFFSTMLISSVLGYRYFGINGNSLGLKVIFFDTEQAPLHVKKIAMRIERMLGFIPENFEIYMLRGMLPEKMQAVIEYYLSKNSGLFSFIIIDGIVDLMYDFNSLPESRKISTKLLNWSATYKCHIVNVLHTNKDFGNARGHIGAELMNKSETVFRITKEDSKKSIVTCELSRNEGFEEFKFSIEDGLPVRKDLPTGYCNREEIPF